VTFSVSSGLVTGGSNTDSFSDIQTFEGNTGTGGTTFNAGAGNNTYEGEGSGTNTLSYAASTGTVTINTLAGTAQNGFGGTDNFSGIADFVGGDLGNTFVAPSVGSLSFTGQGTSNILDYSEAPEGIEINANTGTVVGLLAAPGTRDTFSDIQIFDGSAAGNTTFVAGSGGGFTFTGQANNNTLDFSNATGTVTIDTATGTAQNGSGGSYTFSDIQNFIGATSGNTTFVAGSGGGFTFIGQASNNKLDFSNATGTVTIDAATGTARNGSGGSDAFSDIQNFIGAASGNITFVAPPVGGLSFTGQGSNNTLDFGGVVTSRAEGLIIDAATGTATAVGGADTFSDIQIFDGSADGNTTFVAGSGGGFTFTGEASNNTLDLSGWSGVLTLNTATGTVQVSTNTEHFSDIQTFKVANVSGTVVSNGISLIVESGGTASDTVVSSGGFLSVASGGTADPTTIYAGGSETVSSGASDDGALISGGEQQVFGSAANATVFSGGLQQVESGGTVSGTVISGGTLEVLSGGLADPTTIYSGGLEVVSAGGTDSGAQISGGEQDVYGSAVGAAIFAGYQYVYGGTASDTTIDSGGIQVVESGGTASDTTINSGGQQFVFSGTAISTLVSSGGYEYVESGGVDSGAQISGGEQDVYGSAIGATVFTGSQVVETGGTASNTIISGGVENVVSGGTASGVTFAGPSGTLDLAQPGGLSGTLSGWQNGDTIDFVSTSVTSAAISGSTLTITVSGGTSFSYQLAGQEANTLPSLQGDGSGGTDLELSNTPCYCRGTLIRTRRGRKRVENLKIGDTVLTMSGIARPIRWNRKSCQITLKSFSIFRRTDRVL
jgi:autotransporter passenger strand-loop-strand repeat protein